MSIASRTNRGIEITRVIGSPFLAYQSGDLVESDELYQYAFKNRIALLYLLALKHRGALDRLREQYERLANRAHETLVTAARVATVLSSERIPYVVIKTVRPFPATPNDVDVLILGSRASYTKAMTVLEDAGYVGMDPAPLQRSFVDPRGKAQMRLDKAGGTYYVDLYRDPGVDRFVYLDKAKLTSNLSIMDIDGREVTVLRAEVDAATIMFHSVFPENTFSLEVAYMIWERLAQTDSFDEKVFRQFVRSNHMVFPIRCCLTIAAKVHESAFGDVSLALDDLLSSLGGAVSELVDEMSRQGLGFPYKFSPSVYWRTFLAKLVEPVAFASLIDQGIHMLQPASFLSTMKSLHHRLYEDSYRHV